MNERVVRELADMIFSPFNCDEIKPGFNWEGFHWYEKKPEQVLACQIHYPEGFTVTAGDGTVMHGNPGDYLVTGPDNQKSIVRKDIFEDTFQLLRNP